MVSQSTIFISKQILQMLPGLGELPDRQVAWSLRDVVQLVGRDRPEVVLVQDNGTARRGTFDVTDQHIEGPAQLIKGQCKGSPVMSTILMPDDIKISRRRGRRR
ncbi:hypothetical protein ACIRRH_34945 [Kitasatospora sp. NPDC101235]|uniref:hypothetical protein n=1 Tax=Kitasatospora sp. NPDC101235 TaxID=3364101 RepID=UPI00381197C4